MPQLDGRISPVFDSAGSLLLVEISAAGERTLSTHSLEGLTPLSRADLLTQQGVNVLLCAGISRMTAQCVEAAGVEVIDGIVGSTVEVVDAYLSGTIGGPGFAMPGFGGRGAGRGRGCRGQGRGGRGRGRGGKGRGRGGQGGGQGGYGQGQGRGFGKDAP